MITQNEHYDSGYVLILTSNDIHNQNNKKESTNSPMLESVET